MLILLYALLFGGGGTSGTLDFIADAQDQVKVVMERGDRQKEARDMLKAMEKRSSQQNKVISNTQKDLKRVLADSDATEEDIDTIWYRYFAQRAAYNRDILDLRYQLQDHLTRDEWEQLFPSD